MIQQVKLTTTICERQFGQRLDQALTKIFSNYSRSCIKKWILDNRVIINNKIWNKPKKKVLGKENVIINIEDHTETKTNFKPQNIPLNIVYEDDDIIVVNKQRNLVVHPGIKNSNGTLLNALLNYYPPIVNLPLAGIVHRLDKDTTGLMIIAKISLAQIRLINYLKQRKITREYEGIVVGRIMTNDSIKKPISRHPIKRTSMTVNLTGKPSVTHFYVTEHFHDHTRLRIRLETGRTHQIRVHMSHIAHPLVGDQQYGYLYLPKGASQELITTIRKFDRQALHASTLHFYHPISGIKMKLHTPIPQDMAELIKVMRKDYEERKLLNSNDIKNNCFVNN